MNWAGLSEEEFNKQLAECATEQERATLITNTLNKEYEDAAKEYNELTKSTQDARRATAEMEETQAEIGGLLEPLTTAWTNLKAQALEAMIPVIETVVEAFNKVSTWMDENPEKAEIVKGVLLGIVTALGLLALALGIGTLIQTVTAAFAALNLTMLANPIVLIVAALAGLVAAFIYLWNNCTAFREFWINLWEILKDAASAVAEWFQEAWASTLEWFEEAVSAIGGFFSNAWKKVKEAFSTSIIGAYFRGVWETIKNIFAVVAAVLSGNWSDAWEAIKRIVNTWKDYFSDIYNKIIGVFANIRNDFFSVGDAIIQGIWDGLKAGWEWLKNMVRQLASSLFDAACSVLGIASPSKEFKWVGEMVAQGQGVGYEAEMDNVEQDMKKRIAEMTANVQATVSAENARVGQSMGTPDTGFSDLARAVGTQTAGINSLAGEYRRGSNNMRPIILQLDKREVGRAFVDVFNTETTRVGLSMGGA